MMSMSSRKPLGEQRNLKAPWNAETLDVLCSDTALPKALETFPFQPPSDFAIVFSSNNRYACAAQYRALGLRKTASR